MSEKVDVAVKGIKELDREVDAFKMRLEGIKSEIENLKAHKESLQKEIETKKSVHNQEMDRNRQLIREEAERVSVEKADIVQKREELKQVMLEFQKEKNALETEKTKALDMQENYTKMSEKANQFIVLVRRASEGL